MPWMRHYWYGNDAPERNHFGDEAGSCYWTAVGCLSRQDVMTINGSYYPVADSHTIKEQEAAGVCFLYAKHSHISVDCPRFKERGARGGSMPRAEDKCNWCHSSTKMRNISTHFIIWQGSVLNSSTSMHQHARTGIGGCDKANKAPRKRSKKRAHVCNVSWREDNCDDLNTVNHFFGANEENIKPKSLKALRLLRQAESTLDEIFTYLNNV
jgi:hypothetical protein